jgi:hypothetical protein
LKGLVFEGVVKVFHTTIELTYDFLRRKRGWPKTYKGLVVVSWSSTSTEHKGSSFDGLCLR